ncbi:hypothetical protein Hanom_Chr09g00809561 [Helianthus anomalus]
MLYGIKMTGHILCVFVILLKGLNPSEDSPNRTLLESSANLGYRSSKCFQALPSAGWRNTPFSSLRIYLHL